MTAEAQKVMTSESWQVKRLSGTIGAEITNADLSSTSEADIAAIKQQLLNHKVIFFPGQELTVEQHVALGSHFGELEGHPNLKNTTGHPKLFELKAQEGGVADEWHSDITFQTQPALMSVLKMVKCPPAGGDTMWSNLEAAFNELSEPMRDLCEQITALHDATPHNKPDIMAIHPVIRVHPETGEKSLYVNEHFTRRIVEMNASESEMLLGHLTNWVKNPRFTVRYKWTEGTIAMWDNRCTQHFVLNDFDGERIIQRVTVMGDSVEGTGRETMKPYIREGRLSATSRHDRQLFMHLKAEGKLG